MNEGIKQALLGLRRWQKTIFLMVSDAILVSVALWLAFVFRIGPPSIDTLVNQLALYLLTSVTAVACFWMLGTYSHLLRAMSIRILNILAIGLIVAAALIAVYGFIDTSAFIPRSIPLIFPVIAISLVGASRIAGRALYRNMVGLNRQSQPIMIYGAGEAGTHVAAVLDNSREFSFVGFIDDDRSLWGNRIRGRKVHPVGQLKDFSARFDDLRVLICIANITPVQKLSIIERLQEYPVQVLTIPPLPEIVAGRGEIAEIKEVRIEELLGREAVPPIDAFFEDAICNKTVLVTGGGGSIGSEICRQIFLNKPAKLVVIENSEFALYKLEQSLAALGQEYESHTNPETEFILADVRDAAKIEQLFSRHKPEIVYHAAAYKHVPIIEDNVNAGIANNILGTFAVAKAAATFKAERFVLVSTDKAVRPTNVMGATKRMAELVIQAFAQKRSKTAFSMVRFGNVLGSSGSVIPLFRNQIATGGPVTVTHPEITRFFMTINEAAQLVIQAGSMAKGGEVFLLDMGEPVEIVKLARLMIQLSGKTTRDASRPNGDVEIVFTGLRPGEKLYEELLVNDDALATQHPKIMMASEKALKGATLEKIIVRLKKSVETDDVSGSLEVLSEFVEGFDRGKS